MSYLKTAEEMVAAWDSGDSVWSLEMGGMGPGYEQAIQVLAIELMRDNLAKPLPDAELMSRDWGDDTVHRINDWPGCGFSGAQVGAAKQIAYRFLLEGPDVAIADFKKNAPNADDRLILVSKTWPRAPESK